VPLKMLLQFQGFSRFSRSSANPVFLTALTCCIVACWAVEVVPNGLIPAPNSDVVPDDGATVVLVPKRLLPVDPNKPVPVSAK